MFKNRPKSPSPSMIVALIALFAALGGTVYAAGKINGKTIKVNSEPGNRLKDDTVTGKQVNESSLSVVPDASRLQGQPASAFAPSGVEGAHVVGATGEPPYENAWGAPGSTDEAVSFYRDPYGIVHVQGSAEHTGASTATIFTLPPGYRPAKDLYFAIYGGPDTTTLAVTATGAVTPSAAAGTAFAGLSNVTFRAGL